ncbi:MAG: hypothetical protein LBF27_29125 [Sphingobacterium sp.]|jgi:hypothetical protein|nr:hypothetical protein [Sphingobacterium sp.]
MKRFFPFILLASLTITACSKNDSPDPDKQIAEIVTGAEIRDKYLFILPELKDYKHFTEGQSTNKKYKTIAANTDIDFIVGYIDDTGKLFSKRKFKIDSSLKGKIGQIHFMGDNTSSDISILAISEKMKSDDPLSAPLVAAIELIYPNGNQLSNIGRTVTHDLFKYMNNTDLTYKTVYYYSNMKLFIFDRYTLSPILIDAEVPKELIINALDSHYYEDNKVIGIYDDAQTIKIKCFPIKSSSTPTLPLWENSIKGYIFPGNEKIEMTDDKDNVIIRLKEKNLVYKFKKSNGELVQ